MKKSLVIYPFLFAIFPILSLFSHNIGEQISINEIVGLLATTTFLAFLLWSLLSFVLKDRRKAGLIVSLSLLLFFSYGRFHDAIWNLAGHSEVWGFEIGRHRYHLATWGVIFAIGTYFSLRTRRNLRNVTFFLNIVTTSLVAIPIITVAYVLVSRDKIDFERQIDTSHLERPDKLPDIYYIILDGYARADILEENYQYDNSKFLDYLVQKGFYIANKSRANYPQTSLSMASSLNCTYLDDLANQIGAEYAERWPLHRMIDNNNVFNFLKQYGYVFVRHTMFGTKIRNADDYVILNRTPPGSLSRFQNIVINTTAIPVLLWILSQKLSYYQYTQYESHRKQIFYFFDYISNWTKMNSPVFVYAHIMAPHPPFVFGENGKEINPTGPLVPWASRDEFLRNYKGQLIYINKKVKETIDDIISNAPEPPIIILQSDHGPASLIADIDQELSFLLDQANEGCVKAAFKERMSILNAYYLPNGGHAYLYDEITPVNTFRIIFNHYFGANYELLEDESYFSTWKYPYKFINITDKTNG